MSEQNYLIEQSKRLLKDLKLALLRGVIAEWKAQSETAILTFYFEKKPSESEIEEASIICTEIIAAFPSGKLEERYLEWDLKKELPKNQFWVYLKEK